MLDDVIAAGKIKRHTGERGSHFKTAKTCFDGSMLTMRQQLRTEAAPRPCRMHEKGANLCCICLWIEKCIIANHVCIAAAKSLAATPSSTGHDLTFVPRNFRRGFDDEIRAIRDQLRIEREDGPYSDRQLIR